jgi:succinoglycan biosynthesis protein ExoA
VSDEPATRPVGRLDDELVTVVIPARNEESSIGSCLGSVLGQDHQNLQVIVVDGASTDATPALVQEAAERDPRVELLTNTSGAIPISLNLGLAAARSRWFVRVDAHSTIPPDYVRTLVGELATGRWGGVGGRKDAVASTRMGKAIATALGSRAGVGNSAYHYAQTPREVDHVPFGVYPVALLRDLGGWDERLEANEDFELDHRLRGQGYALLLDPSVRISWRCRETLGGLFQQYRRYGRGKADVAKLHPGSLKARHLAAPALVAAAVPWAVLVAAQPSLGLGLAALYPAFLLVSGTTLAVRAGDPASGLRIAAAVGTMHVAWGLGFWSGVLRPGAARTEDVLTTTVGGR